VRRVGCESARRRIGFFDVGSSMLGCSHCVSSTLEGREREGRKRTAAPASSHLLSSAASSPSVDPGERRVYSAAGASTLGGKRSSES
jgi:hypothetical protein